MARGEYGTSTALPSRAQIPQHPDPTLAEMAQRAQLPHVPQSPPLFTPWTPADSQALTRSLATSTLGAVAGAVAWKEHRVWGFILGSMAGGAIGRLIFAPPP